MRVAPKKSGMSSHQSSRMLKDEWLTPPWLIERLGPFDLDPCSPVTRPWDTARIHYTKADNGLSRQWLGRVWCNPPYGRYTGTWLKRCFDHGNAIALIFARTETEIFFEHVWKADALLFLRGRLYFYSVNGERAKANSGAPSVLVAYGSNNAVCLKIADLPGAWVGAKLIKESPLNYTQQHATGLEDSAQTADGFR